MCRLTAYLGTEIPLENIIIRPAHSLLVQSHDAEESKIAVNGDGFGIAWYGHDERPGLYRDVLPAWADANLTNLCRMVKSGLFLAHVRASTTGETMRTNCHPFTYGKWSFMHNGQVGDFHLLRRNLENILPDPLYNARNGTTDSELLFHLLMHFMTSNGPKKAAELTIEALHKAAEDTKTDPFLRLTCVFSDGVQLYGFRYATDAFAPTLYFANNLDNGGASLSSEPLDGNEHDWHMIDANCYVEVKGREKHIEPLSI